MAKISDRLLDFIGAQVVVEGTFPIPVQDGRVAYAPARGRLVAVFDEGFELVEGKDDTGTVYVLANIRSITLMPKESAIVTPKGRILMPNS